MFKIKSLNDVFKIFSPIVWYRVSQKSLKINFFRSGNSGHFLAQSAQKCSECPKISKSVQSVQKCPKWPESAQGCQTTIKFYFELFYGHPVYFRLPQQCHKTPSKTKTKTWIVTLRVTYLQSDNDLNNSSYLLDWIGLDWLSGTGVSTALVICN